MNDIKKEKLKKSYDVLKQLVKKVKNNHIYYIRDNKNIRKPITSDKRFETRKFSVVFYNKIEQRLIEIFYDNFIKNKKVNEKMLKNFSFVCSLLSIVVNFNINENLRYYSEIFYFNYNEKWFGYNIKTGKFFINDYLLFLSNHSGLNVDFLNNNDKYDCFYKTNKEHKKFFNEVLNSKKSKKFSYLDEKADLIESYYILDDKIIDENGFEKKKLEKIIDLMRYENGFHLRKKKFNKTIYELVMFGRNIFFDKNFNKIDSIKDMNPIEINGVIYKTNLKNIFDLDNNEVDFTILKLIDSDKKKTFVCKIKKSFSEYVENINFYKFDIIKMKINMINAYFIRIKNLIYVIDEKKYKEVLEKVKNENKIIKYFINNIKELEEAQQELEIFLSI